MFSWVYHPYHEPIMVKEEKREEYYLSGWFDSPAKFPAVEVKDNGGLFAQELKEVKEVKPEESAEHKTQILDIPFVEDLKKRSYNKKTK